MEPDVAADVANEENDEGDDCRLDVAECRVLRVAIGSFNGVKDNN